MCTDAVYHILLRQNFISHTQERDFSIVVASELVSFLVDSYYYTSLLEIISVTTIPVLLVSILVSLVDRYALLILLGHCLAVLLVSRQYQQLYYFLVFLLYLVFPLLLAVHISLYHLHIQFYLGSLCSSLTFKCSSNCSVHLSSICFSLISISPFLFRHKLILVLKCFLLLLRFLKTFPASFYIFSSSNSHFGLHMVFLFLFMYLLLLPFLLFVFFFNLSVGRKLSGHN